jgi:putative membrane protein
MGQPGQPGTDVAIGREERNPEREREELQKFVEKAAMSNMAEIELGRLAQERAQDPEVKQFAQMMIDAHTKAHSELQQAASGAGVTIPSSLDEKHQKNQQKLSNLNGSEFDREYMKLMVKAHKDTQKLLEKRVRNAGASVTQTAGVTGSDPSAAGAAVSGSGTETTTGTTPSGAQGTSGSSSSGTAGTSGTSGSSSSEAAGTSGSASASASESSAPATIDSWAANTLPNVQQHLQQAQELEKRVKDNAKNNAQDSDRTDK